MKRFFLCVLVMCLVPVMALTEYASLSDDELKDEFRRLYAEIISRGIWMSDTIPAGVYVAGESVPAGTYELIPSKTDTIQVYASADAWKNHERRILFVQIFESEPYVLTLTDGVVFDLGASCQIRPFGLSW